MLERGHVLDIYDDADGVHIRDGEVLKKFGSLRVDPAEQVSALPDTEFALVVMTKTGEKLRKFPLNTPDALALSAHYFGKTAQALSKEARTIAASNIARAHLRFGCHVPDELAKEASDAVVGPYCKDGVAEPAATEKPMAKFAFETKLGDGRTLKMFPVHDEAARRQSAETFRKVAFEMPPRRRYEAAAALAAAGVKDELVEKFASPVPNPALSAHLAVRREMVQDEAAWKALDAIEKQAQEKPGAAVAEALEAFDIKHGIDRLWEARVRNPWDSCFTVKTASVKVGGRDVTREDLAKLIDSGKLATMFKQSTIKEFRKDPLVVFESLPGPTKETIAQMIG
jgi:hypothetical protein